jgi:phage-related tail protein
MTNQQSGPTETADMNNDELLERIHALETAQATQAASLAGAEATQAAAHAGNMATTTAMTTGTMTTMAAGSMGLIAGIFLGLAIGRR